MKKNKLQQFEEGEAKRITQKIYSILEQTKNQTHTQINEIINSELKENFEFPGGGDLQRHYSEERIKEKIFSDIQPGRGDSKSILWFNFYVYFRIPFTIMIGIILLSLGGLVALFLVIYLTIFVILFWGLKKRRLWAWKMNFVVLILEAIIAAFGKFDGTIDSIVVIILGGGLFWLLPNWIYFKKRKYLFLYSRS